MRIEFQRIQQCLFFYLTQFNQFSDIPEQCEIEMTIDKQSGKITMEGLKEELDKAKDKIFDLLRKFQKERWLDEEAKLVADTVQWSMMVCKYCHCPKPFILNSSGPIFPISLQ